ncbi:MAG: BolA family transcriptional regulator, partial [Shewanella sp.]
MSNSNSHAQGSVAHIISQKLTESFSPTHLEVINESNRHHVP